MSLIEITRQQQRIDALFTMSKELSPEMSAHWGRYLCVLVAGFLETSIQAIYSEYAQRNASPKIARYVQRRVSGFQNPKMQKISELARSFDPDWAAELEQRPGFAIR